MGNGKKWDDLCRFNFRYLRERIRRFVPQSSMLRERVSVVYEHFAKKKDLKTKKPLFNPTAEQISQNVLEVISRGEVSDIAGMSTTPRKETGANYYSSQVKSLDLT